MKHHSLLCTAPATRPQTVTELLQRVQSKGYDLYSRDVFDKEADPVLAASKHHIHGGWAIFNKNLGAESLVTIDDDVRVALSGHLYNVLYNEHEEEVRRAAISV